jgi:hypothetical protein
MDVSLVADFNFNEPKFPSYNKLNDTSPIDLTTQWRTIGIAYLFTTYSKHITTTEMACYAYTCHHNTCAGINFVATLVTFHVFGGIMFASYTHIIDALIWRSQVIAHFNPFASWIGNPKSKIYLAHKFIPWSKYDSISLSIPNYMPQHCPMGFAP